MADTMTALAMEPITWMPSDEGQISRGRIPISIAADTSMSVGKNIASPDPGFALHHPKEATSKLPPIRMASPA